VDYPEHEAAIKRLVEGRFGREVPVTIWYGIEPSAHIMIDKIDTTRDPSAQRELAKFLRELQTNPDIRATAVDTQIYWDAGERWELEFGEEQSAS
jgi:hypothetical protein